jgi:hypothetical protein
MRVKSQMTITLCMTVRENRLNNTAANQYIVKQLAARPSRPSSPRPRRNRRQRLSNSERICTEASTVLCQEQRRLSG